MSSTEDILKCYANKKFKRLNYFHGMLLTENDFLEEQIYFREKSKLHNRMHGAGVVWGLELKAKYKIDGNSKEDDKWKIVIKAGYALDSVGNEVVVCQDKDVDLEEKIDFLKQRGDLSLQECLSPPDETKKIYIGLAYCECKSQPAPQYTSMCSDDELKPEFSRVLEGFTIKLLLEEEYPDCSKATNGSGNDSCLQPNLYCPGAMPCQSDCLVVILGSVAIPRCYSAEYKYIKDEHIDMTDGRKVVFAPPLISFESFQRYEQVKQAIITAVCQSAGNWHDISVVIGKKADIATSILLNTMKMANVYQRTISEIKDLENLKHYIENAKCAIPWVPEGEEIILVIDAAKCVLFAVTNPQV